MICLSVHHPKFSTSAIFERAPPQLRELFSTINRGHLAHQNEIWFMCVRSVDRIILAKIGDECVDFGSVQ